MAKQQEKGSIYIREFPDGFHSRVRKIMGARIARNGAKFNKNDAYLIIFENGLLTLEKTK